MVERGVRAAVAAVAEEDVAAEERVEEVDRRRRNLPQ